MFGSHKRLTSACRQFYKLITGYNQGVIEGDRRDMNLMTLPKAEIHCHLDGTLDPAMLREIVQRDPAFPVIPDEFEKAYPIEGHEDFFDWWQFTRAISDRLDYFYPILDRHLARLKAQNVRYTELMIPSSRIARDSAQAVDEFGRFRAWIDQQEAEQIQVELLIGIGRNKSAEDFEDTGELILALHRAGLIVGVALAGEERGNPVRPFQESFTRFHEAGLGIEIHAGEWCGPESVWDALEHGHPNRIGHGVSAFQDPRLVEAIRERAIHLEMCPTSNLKTGSITALEAHPIVKAKALGLSFSLNTDDPGVVGCSMLSEYELVSHAFGFGEGDFRHIYANTLQARFQPELHAAVLVLTRPGG